jgi:hypothetical protein
MRASGTFEAEAGQGTSDYVGNICLP